MSNALDEFFDGVVSASALNKWRISSHELKYLGSLARLIESPGKFASAAMNECNRE